ncbi:MAG: hypothetical protein L0Y38_09645 [Methylococcaceae bacterium]|nr:hypothetical protein [Methylococcaceae bacterium]
MWLEKIIENIRPDHRLIMVALLDTQLPLELYTHDPKVRVLPVPLPDKSDRSAYLCHRLGSGYPHRELAADLTDGLYLHDLDAIVRELHDRTDADSRGQTVFFTETVVIFTSNIGARALDSRGNPIAEQSALDRLLTANATEDERQQRVREHFRSVLENFFLYEIARPELLNRIGNNIIPFNYIHSVEVQKNIILSHLRRIADEFADKYRRQNHHLHFNDEVVDWLVNRYGTHIGRFGGRGITNAINDEVMLPLAREVLRAEHENASNRQFHLEQSKPNGGIEITVAS